MTTINTYPCTAIKIHGGSLTNVFAQSVGRSWLHSECVCLCVCPRHPVRLTSAGLSPLLWFLTLPTSLLSYCIICYPCLTSLSLACSPECWYYDGDTRLALTPGWIKQLCVFVRVRAGPNKSLPCTLVHRVPLPPVAGGGSVSFFLQYKSPNILVILPSPLPNLPGCSLQ